MLVARDAKGSWTRRDGRDLNLDLSKLYGFPLDVGGMRRGVDVVAAALRNGELARAQIAALLLRLPDPPAPLERQYGALEKRRLAHGLVACGLLKDDDWDEKHPRTGASPNPGWFAPKAGAGTGTGTGTDKPKTDLSPAASVSSRGGAAFAFLSPAPAASVGSLPASDLTTTALDGLATLAGRFSEATILFGAIFVPSGNPIVDEGSVPGRPDMNYRWAHDETSVTFKVLIDGQWRNLAVGLQGPSGVFYDRNGQPVARTVSGPNQRQSLVAEVEVLDHFAAGLRSGDGEPAAAPAADNDEPKLCPDPTREPKTTQSQNSIAYQEYISKLPYGWAIALGKVMFDGCDPDTGILLEAKADIDFMFDENDELYGWISTDSNPRIQMKRQSAAALDAGRVVVWHAQTEKGYRGLNKIADDPQIRENLSVVFDPN